ncbi:MAG: YkgJ family cysteine cluster protein [Gammaproteobacteria bacterium]|jgi:uncharacterized protein|nr:YkgJ family cysteine cluster protein [Gammaproteobacteria bacterium]
MSDDKFTFNFDLPEKSHIQPKLLTPDAVINFRCYPGISCYNACCKCADITLTPYDVIRLKKRVGKTSTEFLKDHTVPFTMDADGVPGVKLRTTDAGACLFMDEKIGCTVYTDRPTACRYYPLGNMAMKHAEQKHEQQHFVLIKEEHCKGHDEPRPIKILDYRAEQNIEEYDGHNKEYFQLILKKKSAGPALGRPAPMSLQLFFMACFDPDRFRRFVLSDAFKKNYDLEASVYEKIADNDIELMYLGFRLLRQVLFAEASIKEHEGALEKRLEERQEVIEMRRKAEIAQARANDPYQAYKAEVEAEDIAEKDKKNRKE